MSINAVGTNVVMNTWAVGEAQTGKTVVDSYQISELSLTGTATETYCIILGRFCQKQTLLRRSYHIGLWSKHVSVTVEWSQTLQTFKLSNIH
jgi:hypothetical protein